MKSTKSSNVVRLPRLLGVTQLMFQYHKLQPGAEKDQMWVRVRGMVINHWLMSNGVVSGRTYSSDQLSLFLGCDPVVIHDYMKEKLMSTRLWDSEKSQEIVEALMGQQLAWVMEDRMEVQNQLELLKNSQGGTYKAFISGEVNKALKLKLDSSTALNSVIRGLTGGSQVNIFAQVNNNQQNNIQQGVTYDEALEIVNATVNAALPDKDSQVKYIEETYDLSSLPQVIAIDQDYDAAKEGRSLMNHELTRITDNYKGNLTPEADEDLKAFEKDIKKLNKKSKHERRRQMEIGESEESPDPENSVYILPN